MIKVKPIDIKEPRRSLDREAIFNPLETIKKKNRITSTAPINPHSSANTEKIKSVCCSGKKRS